ncbi:hypothetical protein EIB18_10955 [Caulobacter vibrioides]|uniref:Uncharacterized protein n=1 Tax=Caulobacter vibrioides (strain NA1000 / CB15N) TaxID=565050 RepID=A0A0H3C948_CAUVN|nr:hypothetical protein [Caulobacter vibrioides]YP_002517521.1 hypothetical protein CCNA_02148 [Caulobacter vibrioides NA1000]ACL95613.1 hypothetical protein CCNA_02148 [Caulobacter vibrioides NA1000]ATC28938.1 hypothetical protein CA607_11280 [Caulobacter vibrioides]AZH13179.1 hypothetical protein EIB18_10955 [Caulobacter vibrioides]QXZ50451.1 hypothetical protein KZH45_11035 [Caulobacter vibrioides]
MRPPRRMPGPRSNPRTPIWQAPHDIGSSPAAPDASGPRHSPGRSVNLKHPSGVSFYRNASFEARLRLTPQDEEIRC